MAVTVEIGEIPVSNSGLVPACAPPHDHDVRLVTEIEALRVSRRQIRQPTEVSYKEPSRKMKYIQRVVDTSKPFGVLLTSSSRQSIISVFQQSMYIQTRQLGQASNRINVYDMRGS